ncbi:hypothetical protein ACFL47_08690 [Candidatus Latescibacterota bacterium]
MKRQTAVLLIVLSVVATVLVMEAIGQEKKLPEGMMPHTPQRMEWLTVLMNANYSKDHITSSESAATGGYRISYSGDAIKNTITINIMYSSMTDREEMNNFIEIYRKMIEEHAVMYGWTSWLKIKEEYNNLSDSSK